MMSTATCPAKIIAPPPHPEAGQNAVFNELRRSLTSRLAQHIGVTTATADPARRDEAGLQLVEDVASIAAHLTEAQKDRI